MIEVYEVKVLRPGYATSIGPARQKASGTITLVKGNKNILVDTGNPIDRKIILRELGRQQVKPNQINYVICTHGHSDHVSNNNLFPKATFILSYDISEGDEYTFHNFKEIGSYRIDEHVEVIYTPGHTAQDISLIVETEAGVIAITGDLFECEEDLQVERLWRDFSEDPEEQAASREKLLQIADFIVPGHGDIFRIERKPKSCKKIFLSSTVFDLVDLRLALASALEAHGTYEVVYNESPKFPIKRGIHSHDVCLDAVKECDIYILVIDKRYGGTYAGTKYPKKDVSITWYEYITAFKKGKEIHTFVRKETWDERPIYKRYKQKYQGKELEPFYVDDIRVFEFIEYVVHQPKCNWIDQFNTVEDLKRVLQERLRV